ncbi:MAG: double zinc ribbon domain-containing protein [Desulfomonilaceae bacterium]
MILREGLHLFKSALSDLFFPPVCAFCEVAIVGSETPLCDDCGDGVDSVTEPMCVQCGLPVPGLAVSGSSFCGRCLADPPAYDRARYAVYYEGVVRDALVRFKFAGALHIASALSQILAKAFHRHFQTADFDLILHVPIHRKRLIHRGFNQVVVLAKKLSQDTGIPLDRSSFKKMKDTPPQVELTRSARIKNLRGSFAIQRPDRIRGRKVLLVDDVATTGSTIAEAAKIIMRGGAARVDVLVLAVRMDVSRPAERHEAIATSEQLIIDNSLSSEDHQQEANHGLNDSGAV